MKIKNIIDNPDGSATLDMEMSEKEMNMLINYGFNCLIKEQIKKMEEAENFNE